MKPLDRLKLWLSDDLPRGLEDFREFGLRWSYLAVAALVLLGLLANLLFSHGWTVWPLVAVVALLLYVHEAADRSGQGVPPLYVYAFFASALLIWAILTLLLTAFNPWILISGLAVVCYLMTKRYLAAREFQRLLDSRRAEGRCLHCGQFADPNAGVCMNCGEEPDPDAAQMQRIQATLHNSASTPGRKQRMRSTLQQDTLSASAKKKEQRLIARRIRHGNRKNA